MSYHLFANLTPRFSLPDLVDHIRKRLFVPCVLESAQQTRVQVRHLQSRLPQIVQDRLFGSFANVLGYQPQLLCVLRQVFQLYPIKKKYKAIIGKKERKGFSYTLAVSWTSSSRFFLRMDHFDCKFSNQLSLMCGQELILSLNVLTGSTKGLKWRMC